MIIIMVLLAVAGGLAFGIQGPVNTAMGKITNSLQGTFTSFAGGTLALILIVSIFGNGDLSLITTAAPWKVIGGMLGMVCVLATVVTIPQLGAGLSVMAVMLGQLLWSTVIDAFGWFEVEKVAVSPLRVIGILVAAVGILFVYRGSRGQNSDSKNSIYADSSQVATEKNNPKSVDHKDSTVNGKRLFALAFAFGSGILGAMQTPINSALAQVVGNWEGTFVSFVVSLITITIVLLIAKKGKFQPVRGVGAKPWMFIGGLLGLCGIFLAITTVSMLGAALQATCCMVGEVGGAILIDSLGLLQTPKIKIDKFRGIGLAIISLGVVLVTVAKL